MPNELSIAETYLSASFKLAELINGIWTMYQTVCLAILAGLVFSTAVRPKQPLGRVLLVLAGLSAFFFLNGASLAIQGQHLDTILHTAKIHFEHAGAMPTSPRPTALDGVFGAMLSPSVFEFRWETSLMAHGVMDVCILIATAWILLTGPKPTQQ